MNLLLQAVVLIGLVGIATAAEIDDDRTWSGVNGKTFRATFDQILPGGGRARFITAKGEQVVVDVEKLLPRDKDLILKGREKPAPPAASDPAAFKPEVAVARKTIPQIDPKKFGASDWEAMTDTLWVSLLWWDLTRVLEVPKKGDLDRKAEWLHKELTRKVATAGKSSVTLEEAKKGVEDYFQENLKEVAACRVTVEKEDLGFARLGSFCEGSNAVILKMTMEYGNGRDFSICMALESIDSDGRFAFHVFGKRFTGIAKVVPADEGKGKQDKQVEFVLENRQDLPDQYARNEARFFLGGKSWNGVLVIKPYVFLTPGKPVPLPPAPEPVPVKK